MNSKTDEISVLRQWLAVLSAPGVGPMHFARFLECIADPSQLLDGVLALDNLPTATRQYLYSPDWQTIETDLAWAAQPGNNILRLGTADYPARLREIPDPPPLLYIHGSIEALHTPQLAMVGSRNPSASGLENAQAFATHLASVGLTITSGLALGIDAACHRGALHSGGTTVAVMGTGLDRVYPARHRDLAHEIVSQGGTLVAEFPIGTGPRPENFPRRNRIISGLSLGTLVVEAAPRSGSLTTARHAGEQGREVFAIPGSIHNPMARGCHALIRQGAKLVESAMDVLEELGVYPEDNPQIVTPAPDGPDTLTPDQIQLLDYMGFDTVSIDQLVTRSGLTAAAVSSMLLILELDGRVKSQAGGRYVRSESRG